MPHDCRSSLGSLVRQLPGPRLGLRQRRCTCRLLNRLSGIRSVCLDLFSGDVQWVDHPIYVACVPLHKVPWANKHNLTGGPPYCPAASAANAPYTGSQSYAISLGENCPQKRRCYVWLYVTCGFIEKSNRFPSLGNNRGRERELLPYHNSIKQILVAELLLLPHNTEY